MIVIITLCMLDYILTYIGIKLKFIVEGNPLMIWLFKLNFIDGFMIKLFIAIILIIPLYICNKSNTDFTGKCIKLIITIYLFVMILHIDWIVKYIMKVG